MENEIRDLLGAEIKERILGLSDLTPGGQEFTTAVDDLAKLYKLRIEETKEDKQLSEQVRDRYFRLGISAAEIVLPLVFYAVWMRKGFKFEETGTFTSTTFRGLFNRFRPTK